MELKDLYIHILEFLLDDKFWSMYQIRIDSRFQQRLSQLVDI